MAPLLLGDTPPIVGEVYRVPCVAHPTLSGVWYPVLGERHIDPVVDPHLPLHWHYDPRFMDTSLVRKQLGGLQPEQVALLMAHTEEAHTRTGEPELRELWCLRLMPTIPVQFAPWVGRLQVAHADDVCDCHVCPHARAPLQDQPRELVDGELTVTCPNHFLRWSLATGRLVPRPALGNP